MALTILGQSNSTTSEQEDGEREITKPLFHCALSIIEARQEFMALELKGSQSTMGLTSTICWNGLFLGFLLMPDT